MSFNAIREYKIFAKLFQCTVYINFRWTANTLMSVVSDLNISWTCILYDWLYLGVVNIFHGIENKKIILYCYF